MTNPPTPDQLFAVALRHHQAGQLREAEQLYRHILSLQPTHANALHLLGVMAAQAGRSDIAIGLIQSSLQQNPAQPAAWGNLGNALRSSNRLDEAMACYHRALALKPDFADAHSNLGLVLQARSQFDEAIASYRRAIALDPNHAEALTNLGTALRQIGELVESLAVCEKAVALAPASAETQMNLANMLRANDRMEEAIQVYRKAIALKPDYADAYGGAASALKALGRIDDALIDAHRAVELQPGNSDSHLLVCTLLNDMGRQEEATAAVRAAIAAEPEKPQPLSNLIFSMYCDPRADERAIAREQREWNRRFADPLPKFTHPRPTVAEANRRLRVGYVSPDLHVHPVARCLLPLFANHDPATVEVVAYCDHLRPDEMTRRLQQHVPTWRNVVGRSDQWLADLIRADKIDILVDCALHTANNRLLVFARRPAPIQVSFAGYPASTGLTTIDYRFTDPFLDPPGEDESVYSEKLWRLPDSFWCVDLSEFRDLPVSDLPALKNGFITFGCLNSCIKMNAPTFALWARILREVPNSRLLLLSYRGAQRQQLLDMLAAQQIDPARIEFADRCPARMYMQLYNRIDIGLDCFPYNGHTTSLDSLYMGVPVLTYAGSSTVARAGWCQLSNLGLADLAGKAPDDFVRITVNLANDLPRLGQLRSTLRQKLESSPLMDGARYARNIEHAYRQMWMNLISGAK